MSALVTQKSNSESGIPKAQLFHEFKTTRFYTEPSDVIRCSMYLRLPSNVFQPLVNESNNGKVETISLKSKNRNPLMLSAVNKQQFHTLKKVVFNQIFEEDKGR